VQKNLSRIKYLIKEISDISKKNKKKTAFLIGNTSKSNNKKFYLTPIREFNKIILFGAIIYNEKIALQISKIVDGKVDYVFVDSEKKIKKSNIHIGEAANIERTVRENISKSNLMTYKGNDLTVEALDLLISNKSRNEIKGLGSKKISILGAGNLGSKIALKLVERGAKVLIYRRNLKKLRLLTKALNIIKPDSTIEKISYSNNIYKVVKNADVIIGSTDGIPIIDKKMLLNSKKNVFVVDVGKGTVKKEAIKYAIEKNITIFRLDITAALAGMIESNIYFNNLLEKSIGYRVINGQKIVSGGLLAEENDVVVDNINNPKKIYGLSDGMGDIKNSISRKDNQRIKKIKLFFKIWKWKINIWFFFLDMEKLNGKKK